jgi:ABC-type transport system involved in multi-copper enzyme maturation permease subunit
MFAAMCRIETHKLYRRKVLWLMLAALAGLIVLSVGGAFVMIAAGFFDASSGVAALFLWPDALGFGLNLASNQSLGALLVMVLAAVLIAQEYDWQGHALWLRQGASRNAVLGAKVVVLLGSVALIVAAALLVGSLASGLSTWALRGELSLARVDVAQVGLSALRTAYTLLPYAALAVLFAVWTRSLAASIALGIGYTFLVEGLFSQLLRLVGGLPGRIALYLPGQMATAVMQLNQGMIAGPDAEVQAGNEMAQRMFSYLSPKVAALGIAVYVALFVGLAFWRFRRQDLTA